MSFSRTAAERTLNKILAILAEQPTIALHIAARVHVGPTHLRRYLLELRSRGLIHISAWTRDPIDGMKPYPREVWALGAGKDAPRPTPKSDTDVSREYRQRMRDADPLRFAMRRRQDRLLARAPRPDAAARWLT